MINLPNIVLYGVILSFSCSLVILLSLWVNPRLWLQDYPKSIQCKVPAKTKEEKQQSLVWGIPFLILLLAIPLISCLRMKHHDGSSISYLTYFINAFGVAFVFNVVDLLLIDWLLFCAITPKFMVIPGTEGMVDYKNYRFHFKAFLIGTVLSALAGMLLAAIAMFL